MRMSHFVFSLFKQGSSIAWFKLHTSSYELARGGSRRGGEGAEIFNRKKASHFLSCLFLIFPLSRSMYHTR
jgi:hypothetical protein